MCVRCGTGSIAWCTSPDQHASEGVFNIDDIRRVRLDPRGECTCEFTPVGRGAYVLPAIDQHCPVHVTRPLKVHGPLDTPAMQHNQELVSRRLRELEEAAASLHESQQAMPDEGALDDQRRIVREAFELGRLSGGRA
jgi:hypothetical protein